MLISIGDKTKEAMDLLGISNYPFSVSELKSKYREAAKKNHSDKGGSDKIMKKINAANDHLLNLALEDVSENQMNTAKGLQRKTIEKDMFTLYEPCGVCDESGIRIESILEGRKECPTCSGVGKIAKDNHCRACKGTGKFKQRSGRTVDCYRCKGSGIFSSYQKICNDCIGFGKVPNFRNVEKYCYYCNGTGEVELKVYNPVIRKGAIL